MMALLEQVADGRLLDDATEIHHRDAMREVLDDLQVVRDEQEREPFGFLQILQ